MPYLKLKLDKSGQKVNRIFETPKTQSLATTGSGGRI